MIVNRKALDRVCMAIKSMGLAARIPATLFGNGMIRYTGLSARVGSGEDTWARNVSPAALKLLAKGKSATVEITTGDGSGWIVADGKRFVADCCEGLAADEFAPIATAVVEAHKLIAGLAHLAPIARSAESMRRSELSGITVRLTARGLEAFASDGCRIRTRAFVARAADASGEIIGTMDRESVQVVGKLAKLWPADALVDVDVDATGRVQFRHVDVYFVAERPEVRSSLIAERRDAIRNVDARAAIR